MSWWSALPRSRGIGAGERGLAEYEAPYNGPRPHRSRQLRPPGPDQPVAGPFQKRIKRRPVPAASLSEYERAA
jgi:putative transposase